MHVMLGHDLFKFSAGHVSCRPTCVSAEEELSIHRSVLRRAQVSQQSGHFVERPPANGLGVSGGGQVIANLLLVIPQKPMQGKNIG